MEAWPSELFVVCRPSLLGHSISCSDPEKSRARIFFFFFFHSSQLLCGNNLSERAPPENGRVVVERVLVLGSRLSFSPAAPGTQVLRRRIAQQNGCPEMRPRSLPAKGSEATSRGNPLKMPPCLPHSQGNHSSQGCSLSLSLSLAASTVEK